MRPGAALAPLVLALAASGCSGGAELIGRTRDADAASFDAADLPPDAREVRDLAWGDEAQPDGRFEPGPAEVGPDIEEEPPSEPLPELAPESAPEHEPDLAPEPSPEPPPDLGPDVLAEVAPDPGLDPGPEVVYDGIYEGLGHLTGQTLVYELCHLVKDSYNGVSYDKAGDLLVDFVDSYSGKVEELYTGDLVPGGNGLNTEHTWPQSKGAVGEAKSDMFHLFPTWPNYNSARGNIPYGKVVWPDWPSSSFPSGGCADHFVGHPEGCDSIRGDDAHGVPVFEPRDAVKGDVARAIFYFSVRYGSGCKVKPLSVFDPAHPAVTEAILKEWNALDPPDDHERERNDRIEQWQNVRNPFIDHPEFADRVSFQ